MANIPHRPTPRQVPQTLRLATVDPETKKSIDEVVEKMVSLHTSGEMKGIIVYALGEDDEVYSWCSANLSTREVIGALTQLSIEMHLLMMADA